MNSDDFGLAFFHVRGRKNYTKKWNWENGCCCRNRLDFRVWCVCTCCWFLGNTEEQVTSSSVVRKAGEVSLKDFVGISYDKSGE